jgi:hypothetical protein
MSTRIEAKRKEQRRDLSIHRAVVGEGGIKAEDRLYGQELQTPGLRIVRRRGSRLPKSAPPVGKELAQWLKEKEEEAQKS